LKCNTRNVTR